MIVAGAYGYSIEVKVGFDLTGAQAALLRVQLDGETWTIPAVVHDVPASVLRVPVSEGDFSADLAGTAMVQVVVVYGPSRRRISRAVPVTIAGMIPVEA